MVYIPLLFRRKFNKPLRSEIMSTKSKIVYVVIGQVLGIQYELVGVYASKERALDTIGGMIGGGWTTDHNACDAGVDEVGRWINEGTRGQITLHEDMIKVG